MHASSVHASPISYFFLVHFLKQVRITDDSMTTTAKQLEKGQCPARKGHPHNHTTRTFPSLPDSVAQRRADTGRLDEDSGNLGPQRHRTGLSQLPIHQPGAQLPDTCIPGDARGRRDLVRRCRGRPSSRQ